MSFMNNFHNLICNNVRFYKLELKMRLFELFKCDRFTEISDEFLVQLEKLNGH